MSFVNHIYVFLRSFNVYNSSSSLLIFDIAYSSENVDHTADSSISLCSSFFKKLKLTHRYRRDWQYTMHRIDPQKRRCAPVLLLDSQFFHPPPHRGPIHPKSFCSFSLIPSTLIQNSREFIIR